MLRWSDQLTIPEAALRLGITEEEVRLLVRRHILPSQLKPLGAGGMERVVGTKGIEALEEQGVRNALRQVEQEEKTSVVSRLRPEVVGATVPSVDQPLSQDKPVTESLDRPISEPPVREHPREEQTVDSVAPGNAYQVSLVQGLAVLQERLQQLGAELRNHQETLPARVVKELNLPALEEKYRQELNQISTQITNFDKRLDRLSEELDQISGKMNEVVGALNDYSGALREQAEKSPMRQIKKMISERLPDR